MKKINIGGKDYIPVHERVIYFRTNEKYKDYKINNEFIEINDKHCIIKTSILNDKNEVVATGFSREVNGDSYINKTSYIENAETSAIGRALGCLGIGIDTAFASADEIEKSLRQPIKQASIEKEQKTRTIKLTDKYPFSKHEIGNTWSEAITNQKGKDHILIYKNFMLKEKNTIIELDDEFEKCLIDLWGKEAINDHS